LRPKTTGATLPNSSLSAEDIAEHQLLSALRMWSEEDFISTLTLAGAAEEILGKRLRKLGNEPSFEQLKKEIVASARQHGDSDPKTDKLVADLLNQTRNELKHYAGDEALTFDLRADAAEMLERAIANYHLLTDVVPEEAFQFWGDVSDIQK
jgi:hypothetical protein